MARPKSLLVVLFAAPLPIRGGHQAVVLGDACDKYQWTSCQATTDCAYNTGTRCDKVDARGSSTSHCMYANYECVVPSIPGCSAKRCVPVPASAFSCNTDADCETTTGHGDTCEDGLCVACSATPGWAGGGCDFNLTGRAWDDPDDYGPNSQSKCEYSQHLLPGFPCPTGGLAPNGQGQFYPSGLDTPLLGLAAGCNASSVHPNDGGSGICVNGNGPSGFKCNVAPNLGVSLGGDVAFPDNNCQESEHQPCGWDCRDGSAKAVQCAYDQMVCSRPWLERRTPCVSSANAQAPEPLYPLCIYPSPPPLLTPPSLPVLDGDARSDRDHASVATQHAGERTSQRWSHLSSH